jgi:hypothetical protein
MSDWHRDSPEFCDDIDAMLGVPDPPLPPEPVDYEPADAAETHWKQPQREGDAT